MRRPLIVSNLLFRNVDPLIVFGLGIGLLGGLGLAIGGTLLVEHLMTSYQSFLQKSLIGLRGTLTLEASSPAVLQQFYRVWQADSPAVPSSLTWSSDGAIALELEQGTRIWKRQVKVVVLEQEYLRQKLSAQQAGCATNQTQAFGNPLLWLTLVEFDPERPVTLQAKPFGEQKLPLHFSSCRLETGMMTDYPILFLSWSASGMDPVGTAWQLEFSAPTTAETEQWKWKIDKVWSTVPHSATEWLDPKDVFKSKEMQLAATLSEQARFVAAVVFLLTLTLSALILFFGFSLLLEFKHKVTAILRMIGISRAAVAVGFMVKGAQIGVFVAVFGCLIAVTGRWLIRQGAWIPFEHFFMPWSLAILGGTLLVIPLGIALYNAVLIYGLLWQADRKAGVIR